jgi:hypothetical protein
VVGESYTGHLTATTQDPDDGTYSYSWRFDNATGTDNGLTISDQTSPTPTVTGTPETIPGPGYMDIWCYVTDSFANQIHGYAKIKISEPKQKN